MKKIQLLALCIVGSLQAQTVTYQASLENIPNPERGFHRYTKGNSMGTFTPLSAGSLAGYRADSGITLVLRIYLLEAFRTTPISQDFLSKIQADFDILRSSGAKCVMRFNYSNDDGNDADKAQIMMHIEQLKPITIANQDVISSISGGFIAQYGEWYNSDNFGTNNLTAENLADRKEIGLKIMELAPQRMFAFRTPAIQRLLGGDTPITEATAYDGSINSRVAAHNDCFLSDDNDVGTYFSPADYTYVEQQSKYTFDGGESCALSSFSNCPNAIYSMTRFHFRYLSSVYFPEVLTYWQANGCLDEIKRRLGYRLELLNSTIANNSLTLNFQNVGFANIHNERYAYLIMKSLSNGEEFSFPIASDPRFWNAGSQLQIVQSLDFDALPIGSYQLFLNLPDKDIDNPLFAIRCANIGTWDAANGYNNLNQVYAKTSLSTQIFVNNDQINVTDLGQYALQVFDMTGRLVSNSSDISNLPNSVYIVKIEANDIVYTQKIIKR